MKIKIKALLFIIIAGSLVMIPTGCGNKDFEESFTGKWKASQNSLNGNIYTGNIIFSVEEDGSFKIQNDLGNVSMSGILKVKGETEINLKSEGDVFNPPECWDSSETDDYSYEFIAEDVVVLDYLGNKIAFFRIVENQIPEEIKNDNWLNNNGLGDSEVTYRVEITDDEISFYLVDNENIIRTIYGRNLKFDNDKKILKFVPDISVGYEPPSEWYSEMGKEMKEIILDVEYEDNYLILKYQDKEIKFFNDLLYKMDNSSDIYHLMDSTWIYREEDTYYEMMLLFGDTIFTTCLDGEGNEVFNGMILLDETQKTMEFYFDLKSDSEVLWGEIKDQMLISYKIDENQLELSYQGTTLKFTKKS